MVTATAEAPKANHLKSAEIHNYMGVRYVNVQFPSDRRVYRIAGKNRQGKTSTTAAIWAALGGKDVMAEVALREGEKEGSVRLEIDTTPPLIVEMKLRRDKDDPDKVNRYLEVYQETDVGGAKVRSKIGSPQKVLDNLIGTISVDPMEFIELPPAKQVATLAALVGVNVTDLDAQIAALMEQRKEKSRDVAKLAAVVEGMPHHDDAPQEQEIVSTSALVEELSRAEAANRSKAALAKQVEDQDRTIAALVRREADLVAELTKVRRDMESAQSARLTLQDQFESATLVNVEPIKQRISMASELNRKVEDNRHRAASVQDKENIETEVEALTAQIEAKRAERLKLMSEAKWPLEGLGFGDHGVTYKGVPVSQCSSREQIQVGCAVAMAQKPQVRFLSVKNASLIDDEGQRAFEEMAEQTDTQVILEMVGEYDGAIIIEDGRVRGAEG